MANPQTEDGYTRIANSILENLVRQKLSNYESRVLFHIIRETYGYQKKEKEFDHGKMARAIGIKTSHLIRSLYMLIARNFITRTGNEKHPRYGFQKDFEKWIPLPDGVTLPDRVKKLPEWVKHRTRTGNETGLKTAKGKGKGKPKESIKKTLKKYSPNSDEFRLSKLLFDLIKERKPDFKQPNLQDWAKYIDYMIRRDKRKPERIREVIEWCQQDSFWQNNILSTGKLREKFDQLELKMAQEPDDLITKGLDE